MRIGFATIYSWRPHVEHAYFLADLLRRAGHEAFFLTCDADLTHCYTRELRDSPDWLECLKCRAGGIRSYAAQRVSTLGDCAKRDDGRAPLQWAHSSASTLGRFESDEDYEGAEFAAIANRLHSAAESGYRAARAWIREQQLDAVCVFNARIDVTRGIFEAAKSLGVRVVSMERTWFSHGLQLYPEETCMGLDSVHSIVGQWRERPLMLRQALTAASHVARRFLRANSTEWRAYNLRATALRWPIESARRRVLLIPSSRNEVWGHSDWQSQWSGPLAAYDALIEHLGLQPSDMVLRCHPNWAESIGKRGGQLSEHHYAEWARRRGVLMIASADTASTLGLIEQCDAIVVANGSAALEAGILGKQVIATAPSIYQEGGFRDDATSPQRLTSVRLHDALPEDEVAAIRSRAARMTLRFAYSMTHRVSQYTGFVRAQSTTKFEYDHRADPQRFVDLLVSGILRADDETSASDQQEEDVVLRRIEARDWEGIVRDTPPTTMAAPAPVKRRLLYRPVDAIRARLPLGDR